MDKTTSLLFTRVHHPAIRYSLCSPYLFDPFLVHKVDSSVSNSISSTFQTVVVDESVTNLHYLTEKQK